MNTDIVLNDGCNNCKSQLSIQVDKISVRNGNVTVFLRCEKCGSLWNRTYLFRKINKTM